MVKVVDHLLDKSKYSLKAPYSMVPTEITFHNTYNDAPAINEAKYMTTNGNATSFHDAVDDIEVRHCIPYERNAWHAGDGNGAGNRNSIGVEICYSASGGSRYRAAERNAIEHIASLMVRFNITISKVKTHQERNGKYCPHRMLDEGRVAWFKSECDKRAKELKGGNTNNGNSGKVEIKVGNTVESGATGWGSANEIAEALVIRGVEGRIMVKKDGMIYMVAEELSDLKMQELEHWCRYKGWAYSLNGTWKDSKGNNL